MKKNLVFLLAVLLVITKGFSQQQTKQQEPTKKWVYEFNVSGMKSLNDAMKLDSAMTRMMGIYSCKTDYNTKTVSVSCVPGGDYLGLQIMVQSIGLVADDIYILKREE